MEIDCGTRLSKQMNKRLLTTNRLKPTITTSRRRDKIAVSLTMTLNYLQVDYDCDAEIKRHCFTIIPSILPFYVSLKNKSIQLRKNNTHEHFDLVSMTKRNLTLRSPNKFALKF